jgi:hypothetical protein
VETVSARVTVVDVVAKDVDAVVETDSMGTGTAKMGLVGVAEAAAAVGAEAATAVGAREEAGSVDVAAPLWADKCDG